MAHEDMEAWTPDGRPQIRVVRTDPVFDRDPIEQFFKVSVLFIVLGSPINLVG